MTPVLELQNISVSFAGFTAIDRLSLSIPPRTTIGLVGESGSGKSTLARVAAGLIAPHEGKVLLNGQALTGRRNQEQCKALQMVFQNPGSSLNPRLTVRQMLTEALLFHRMKYPADVPARCKELLEMVSMDQSALDRFPSEFSGGQRQRLAIARSLSLNPQILIADEPTSSLDVSVQRNILELLRSLQKELHLTMLFISHDMRVINAVSDTIAVIRQGRLLELSPREEFFRSPRESYSRELLEAIPLMPQSVPGKQ